MSFSLFKHYLDLYTTDTAVKVSQSSYCFTTSISHVVENYFPRLWDTGITDAVSLVGNHSLFEVIQCKIAYFVNDYCIHRRHPVDNLV